MAQRKALKKGAPGKTATRKKGRLSLEEKRSPSREERLQTEQSRMVQIIQALEREYPESRCSLDYKNPFQLLIATILSAQCTDERVNLTTPELFRRFPTPEAMAEAPIRELEKLVQPTGFFRMKARSLQEASRSLVQGYGGRVPRTIEELVRLRGVGRKTANVVLGNAFGNPAGVVVDTHVGRLSRRLGFTRHQDPLKVEMDLMKLVPREKWTEFPHLMISHGRAICTARKAFCHECPVSRYCPKIGVSPSERAPRELR